MGFRVIKSNYSSTYSLLGSTFPGGSLLLTSIAPGGSFKFNLFFPKFLLILMSFDLQTRKDIAEHIEHQKIHSEGDSKHLFIMINMLFTSKH